MSTRPWSGGQAASGNCAGCSPPQPWRSMLFVLSAPLRVFAFQTSLAHAKLCTTPKLIAQ